MQGTAAGINKVAMIRIHERLRRRAVRAGSVPQVHDEILLEAPEVETSAVKELVRAEISSPTRSTRPGGRIGIGDDWPTQESDRVRHGREVSRVHGQSRPTCSGIRTRGDHDEEDRSATRCRASARRCAPAGTPGQRPDRQGLNDTSSICSPSTASTAIWRRHAGLSRSAAATRSQPASSGWTQKTVPAGGIEYLATHIK